MNLKTSFITLTLLLAAATNLTAQTTASVPVPSQFATAHTAFLASIASPGPNNNMAPAIYTSVYQALVKNGHYQLTATPAAAELGMTIAIQDHIDSVVGGKSQGGSYLRLDIYDVKTHFLLWTLDEPVQGALLDTNFEKNIATSVTRLMNDLSALAAGSLPLN